MELDTLISSNITTAFTRSEQVRTVLKRSLLEKWCCLRMLWVKGWTQKMTRVNCQVRAAHWVEQKREEAGEGIGFFGMVSIYVSVQFTAKRRQNVFLLRLCLANCLNPQEFYRAYSVYTTDISHAFKTFVESEICRSCRFLSTNCSNSCCSSCVQIALDNVLIEHSFQFSTACCQSCEEFGFNKSIADEDVSTRSCSVWMYSIYTCSR